MRSAAIMPNRRRRRRPGRDRLDVIAAHGRQGTGRDCDGASAQLLTIGLEGITASDYLSWVRDPEPPLLAVGLHSVTVAADDIGGEIHVQLCWDGPPPSPATGALAAGFQLIPEVAELRAVNSADPK